MISNGFNFSSVLRMICLEDSTFTNSNFVVSVDPNCISKSAATDSHFNSLWSVLLTKNTWFIFWSGLGIITEINAFWCSWHAFVIWIQVDLIYIFGWKAFIITLPPLLRYLLMSKHAGMIWCRLILLLQASTNFQWSISGDFLLTRALLLWTGKRRL